MLSTSLKIANFRLLSSLTQSVFVPVDLGFSEVRDFTSNCIMSSRMLRIFKFIPILKWVTMILYFTRFSGAQDVNDNDTFLNPSVLPFVTQIVYSRISNVTTFLSNDLAQRARFCFKDPEADWDKAFNFSSNLEFLSSCIQKARGDIGPRICTAAEVKSYFQAMFDPGRPSIPNRNCNLTSWIAGCEPGWGCSVDPTVNVELQDPKDIPMRTHDCQPCCEGFFCPQGYTCMIPCPLGSYCPLAKLDKTTGRCEPYSYRIPRRLPNHTCGGANAWADVRSSGEMFCSAGSYCPTTTQKINCSSGHYCRRGSTSEKPCFKLTSCDPNTANQSMHTLGIMVIAALSAILLLIYNCSDQIMMIRERRITKTREAAARTAKARQRWKAAKRAAIKHAGRLQAQVSRTFSRKRSIQLGDTESMLNHTKSEVEETFSPTISNASPSNASSSFGIEGIEMEATKRKGPFSKGNKQSSHTQVFKYAYAQIEKERRMKQDNRNLTFTGLVSLAKDIEMKRRLQMELSFKDLAITLKATGKYLLRNVTGSLKPGRITAVMGPSGAGKTTFLTALAGKPIGCHMSGEMLINGKNESIHSYKKIVGFVPQDDIVHGNLTVEENLWFHARCRLSADLLKADKVLVVERVVDSLGLQAVRNSLVGTVEQRGISGGQRKRVNVGLELVMEPSVLFLDEPTSGLDSTSSQLLLRALRHEALEGVNICMVIHQPSYKLFTMFDDLVLLAKGGLTVYHGPVNEVESYFSGLGINVPDRINPPDYYIDILEGIVTPSLDSTVSYKELPLRWMLHNAYLVPLDMQENGSRHNSVTGENPAEVGHSFVTDLWQDLRHNLQLYHDKLRHNFLKTKDLSHRRTPGLFTQYRYFLGRISKQRLRESRLQATDYLILFVAGACLGSLTKGGEESFGAAGYTYTIIGVSLLCKIAALRSFSLDKLHFWRENASGMSSLASFAAKDTVDLFNVFVKPVVYLSMFYFFTNPRSSFLDNYIVLLCLVYCVTGIAYALAIFFQPGSAQLFSVLLPVVLTLVATQRTHAKFMEVIVDLCYPRWALEAFVISNAERYYGVWLITRCGSLMRSGYDLHEWLECIIILVLIGALTRGFAFIGMITLLKR